MHKVVERSLPKRSKVFRELVPNITKERAESANRTLVTFISRLAVNPVNSHYNYDVNRGYGEGRIVGKIQNG